MVQGWGGVIGGRWAGCERGRRAEQGEGGTAVVVTRWGMTELRWKIQQSVYDTHDQAA